MLIPLVCITKLKGDCQSVPFSCSCDINVLLRLLDVLQYEVYNLVLGVVGHVEDKVVVAGIVA